jgi:hypothetical protein
MRAWPASLALAVVVAALVSAGPSRTDATPSTASTTDVEVHTPRGGEPQIAVNPTDARNLVMGENVDGISYSRDGGATWKHVSLPNLGDNALAVRPDGTFLFTSISGTVWASVDGGETWTDVGNWVGAVAEIGYSLFPWGVGYPLSVGGGDVIREVSCNAPGIAGLGPVNTDVPRNGPGPQAIGCDRPWLVTDPNTGRAYLSFKVHQDPSGGTGGSSLPWELAALACLGNATTPVPAFQCGRQYVAASGDGGRTWTTFKPFDSKEYPAAVTTAWNGGPAASFGRLATAYVATGDDCSPCIVFETSANDGATWDRHIVAPVRFPSSSDPLCAVVACGDASLNTSFSFEPYTAADPSRPGRYAVMVFDASQTHLLVYVTEDWGETWRSVTLAEPGAGVRRWVPWIEYGPTGALGVVWRTSYADDSFDVWAAVAPNGDSEFAAPVRLSSARSPGPVAPGGDDASDVVLTSNTLYAAWGDQRGGPADVAWFGSYSDRVGSYRFAP